jgi:hypothetical protein
VRDHVRRAEAEILLVSNRRQKQVAIEAHLGVDQPL